MPVYQKHTVTSFLNSFPEVGEEIAFSGRVVGSGLDPLAEPQGLVYS